LRHLFLAWLEVSRRIKEAEHFMIITDYDGTLTPIVGKPELAILSENTRQLLKSIVKNPRITLAIISGRALKDVQEKVGISGIVYAGNHGLEIEGPGIKFVHPAAGELKHVFHTVYHVLKETLMEFKGVRVENKGLSISVHYRLAEEDKTEVIEKAVKQVISEIKAAENMQITTGKKVFELRPAVTWDKGNAIDLLIEKYGKCSEKNDLLPMYLGDDLTDEDGFRVIESYGGGLSVFVGEENRQSTARYYLESPSEVETFLGKLLE
jgi:trehalose 6-phosphate phosphatase